jgi:hypothetical protein
VTAALVLTESSLLLGHRMLTVSGVDFSLAKPRAEDVRIEDIAHGLSLTNRYAGQTRTAYNVAQHSVLVARTLAAIAQPREVILAGLMHDAAEAYVGDLTRPVKRLIRQGAKHSAFDYLEDAVMGAIAERFGIALPLPEIVHEHDAAMCAREQLDLGRVPAGWVPPCAPADCRVTPWHAGHAEAAFLDTFHELTRRSAGG